MRVFVPISVGGWDRLFSRWDILAVLLMTRALGVPRRSKRHLFQALADLATHAAVARSGQSARICRAHDAAHARRHGAVAALHFHLRDAGGEEFAGRALHLSFRCSIFSSRCRSPATSRSPSCSSRRSLPGAGAGHRGIPRRSSQFSPTRPGTWRSASTSRCARCRPNWSRRHAISGSAHGCRSGASDVPFAMPQLIWNMMMSMSGSWFFVVASEAISVGNTHRDLARCRLLHRARHSAAKSQGGRVGDLHDAGRDLVYDQVLFRPLVAWADLFRFEQEPGAIAPRSWVLEERSGKSRAAGGGRFHAPVPAHASPGRARVQRRARAAAPCSRPSSRALDWLALSVGLVASAHAPPLRSGRSAAWFPWLSWHDVGVAVGLGAITLLRVFVLIALGQRRCGCRSASGLACGRTSRGSCRSRWRSSWPPSRPTCCSRSWCSAIVSWRAEPERGG